MKRLLFLLFIFLFVVNCTSKTIFAKPDDLISKDSMSLLIKDLLIANAAKSIKNKKFRRKINYLPLVYEKYQIDTARFERSNFYYTSKIDEYEDILDLVINDFEAQRNDLIKIEKLKDSIYKDSIKKLKTKRTQQVKEFIEEDIEEVKQKKKKMFQE